MPNLLKLNPITSSPHSFRLTYGAADVGHLYQEADGTHVFEPLRSGALTASNLRAVADAIDELDKDWLATIDPQDQGYT